jgi:uncharacterized protein (TIGR02284 family)
VGGTKEVTPQGVGVRRRVLDAAGKRLDGTCIRKKESRRVFIGDWIAVTGAGDFRDFSPLQPAKENRRQPVDPAHHCRSFPRDLEREKKMANTLDGSEKNKDMERVLLDVIKILVDGQKGFADIGEHLKDETLKRYFLAESLKRANFRAELENELWRAGMPDVKESGTTTGTVHRVWGDLKAHLGAGSDHQLLATAEQGEDVAKDAYKKALEHDLPLPVRELLTTQQAHILTSHDYVRNHRDALAGK